MRIEKKRINTRLALSLRWFFFCLLRESVKVAPSASWFVWTQTQWHDWSVYCLLRSLFVLPLPLTPVYYHHYTFAKFTFHDDVQRRQTSRANRSHIRKRNRARSLIYVGMLNCVEIRMPMHRLISNKRWENDLDDKNKLHIHKLSFVICYYYYSFPSPRTTTEDSLAKLNIKINNRLLDAGVSRMKITYKALFQMNREIENGIFFRLSFYAILCGSAVYGCGRFLPTYTASEWRIEALNTYAKKA